MNLLQNTNQKHFNNNKTTGRVSSTLITSVSLLFLQVLQGCLNYPVRLNYGQGYQKVEQTRQMDSGAYEPGSNLISSHFVMELSHSQLAAHDPKEKYTNLRRYPVQVYRISYQSRNFTPLSALVLLPVGTDIVDYPVLSYHHGTLLPFPSKNLSAYETPSLFGSRYRKTKKFFAVNAYGLPAASNGYLTILPDYMGYGIQAGAEHPFMMGPELGQESMDAIRAVYQWGKQKGLKLRNKLYLAGTSEGAYAAIWGQRLIEKAPDLAHLQVEGAYYAGPYHISSLLKKLAFEKGLIDPLFNWAVYATWNYYLRDRESLLQNLQAYFPYEKYKSLEANLQSWKKTDIWVRKIPNIIPILIQKPAKKESIFRESFLQQLNQQDSSFWALASLFNIHKGWQPKGPIHLFHNNEDPLIPFSNSEDAYAALSAAGGQVTLQTFERNDHVGKFPEYLKESLNKFGRSREVISQEKIVN